MNFDFWCFEVVRKEFVFLGELFMRMYTDKWRSHFDLCHTEWTRVQFTHSFLNMLLLSSCAYHLQVLWVHMYIDEVEVNPVVLGVHYVSCHSALEQSISTSNILKMILPISHTEFSTGINSCITAVSWVFCNAMVCVFFISSGNKSTHWCVLYRAISLLRYNFKVLLKRSTTPTLVLQGPMTKGCTKYWDTPQCCTSIRLAP